MQRACGARAPDEAEAVCVLDACARPSVAMATVCLQRCEVAGGRRAVDTRMEHRVQRGIDVLRERCLRRWSGAPGSATGRGSGE
jgi:hypothetical protein